VTAASAIERALDGGPVGESQALGRRIRRDGIATLGISSQTLAEHALRRRQWDLAAELIEYFFDEMRRIGEALFLWLEDIVACRLERSAARDAFPSAVVLLKGLRAFDPSSGDRAGSLEACARGDDDGAAAAAELMRVRYAALHDGLVAWIQELLADLAEDAGEDAVLDAVARAAERLWKPRYARWRDMSAEERLQLSVEGMRGHLSGPHRRGDVGIEEYPDRYVMVLDPCGSCGILRRGDPESGRPAAAPRGNRQRHPWTWNRTGVGWYAVHSPIVMEYLWLRDGQPPMRPHEGCDGPGPCRWTVPKDPDVVADAFYERMGFTLAPPRARS
jgi:hypothetical protein